MDYAKSLENFAPQIGEIGQHSINVDQKLVETSEWYYDLIKKVLERNGEVLERSRPFQVEVSALELIVVRRFRVPRSMGFEKPDDGQFLIVIGEDSAP